MIQFIFLYLIFFLLIFSSFMVVLTKNPIISVLFLISSFILSSILFLSIKVEFLSLILIVIYVGAISVLFLFIIMLLNIRLSQGDVLNFLPLNGLVLVFFFFLIFLVVNKAFQGGNNLNSLNLTEYLYIFDDIIDIKVIGLHLYTDYFVLFIISGFILLVAMIGAILLCYQENHNKRKTYYYLQDLKFSFLKKKNIF